MRASIVCGAQPRRAPQLPNSHRRFPTRAMAKKAKKVEEEAPKKGKKKAAAKK